MTFFHLIACNLMRIPGLLLAFFVNNLIAGSVVLVVGGREQAFTYVETSLSLLMQAFFHDQNNMFIHEFLLDLVFQNLNLVSIQKRLKHKLPGLLLQWYVLICCFMFFTDMLNSSTYTAQKSMQVQHMMSSSSLFELISQNSAPRHYSYRLGPRYTFITILFMQPENDKPVDESREEESSYEGNPISLSSGSRRRST